MLFQSERELLKTLGDKVEYIGACDPSSGKKDRRGDRSSIITLVRPADGTLYVLDADIAYRKPDELIETILAYHERRPYTTFAVEVNQFQEFLADQLQSRGNARGLYPRIERITNTTDKYRRIAGLQPLVASGTLQFSRRHWELLEELRQFPRGRFDDGLDGLEMAVRVAGRQQELRAWIIEPKDYSWVSDYRRNLGWKI